MKKLDMLTAALKNGTSIVDVIRENSHELEMEGDFCPCGTPEWEEYVAGIVSTADASRKAAI